MQWVLLILSLGALVLLHLWWRKRFERAEQAWTRKMRDLSGAHQQELASRDSQQKALLDSMVEGLLVLDGNGSIRLTSSAFAQLFGTSSDLVGKTLLEVVRLPELAQLSDRLSAGKTRIEGEELRLTENRWVGVSGAALLDAEGALTGKLLVFHDLTRVKRLERIRQEFVANVSHELRTPLSLIKGSAETLLNGAMEDQQAAVKFLNTIDRNAERLHRLIEDLLSISELESGRSSLDLTPVAVRMLTDKVLADLASRALTRSVRLINSVPDLKVLADTGRLEQVLVNLVDNAIKYGREGGTVEAQARVADGGYAEFTIRDDGPGISPEALPRLFERFYRVDKARSREQGGTGLGLAIVKHIVQNHGGTVRAESAPGHGATFHFTLRLCAEGGQA